jgi:ABC-type Zn2+ transport system substrate-binding protein/surface adhesin
MTVMTEGVSWNYTTFLNIAFLVLAAVLTLRFFRSGGMAMLRMMGGAPDEHHDHAAHQRHEHQGHEHDDHAEHHEHSEHDHGHHH